MKLKIGAPKIGASLEPASNKHLLPDARLEAVVLEDLEAVGLEAKGLSIDESQIEKLIFSEAKLEKLSLSDVNLKGCDFSAADCSDGSWQRVHAKAGRMSGVDLNKCTIKDVVFEGCKLDIANFRFAKLTKVRFEDCVLTEADFQGAELNQVEFAGCWLERVEFGQARLKQVDLRTSTILNLKGWDYIKGVTIDSIQLMSIAPELALAMGLEVKD